MRARSALLGLCVGPAIVGCAGPGGVAYAQPRDPELMVADFEFSDPHAFRVGGDGGGAWLELFTESEYRPPFRSPTAIALVRGREFGDFTFEADLMQIGRAYGHRDLCVFFGFESPSRYYYVHIATKADPNAHNVFVVDDAARRNIATKTTDGVDWGDGVWHRVRIVRSIESGVISVWFDDDQTPIMEANDRTLGWGMVGFGSFDDVGRIRNLRITGDTRPRDGAAFAR